MRNKEIIVCHYNDIYKLFWIKVLLNVEYEASLNRLPDFLIQPLL